MALSRPYWEQHDGLNGMYFFGADSTAHILKTHRQSSERMMHGLNFDNNPVHQCPSLKPADHVQLLVTTKHCPPEGDQVVPSFQKLSVYEQYSQKKSSKPLPPLPDMGDLSSDDGADNEVEFFSSTSETQLLVSDAASKSLAFQSKVPSRRSFAGYGQINYSFYDGLHKQEKPTGQNFKREHVLPKERNSPKRQDGVQSRLHSYHSGAASSLRTSTFTNPHVQEKPEVPPRVPIPYQSRRSVERNADEPPEIPPRQPLFHRVPRAPSPKSLPIYVNGVMPPTQSFAPNPKYVSKTQSGQDCESWPAVPSPCILPIMEDGKKTSATHYFLLPQRPGYLDRFERFFKESDAKTAQSGF